jgi:hypothetical protein
VGLSDKRQRLRSEQPGTGLSARPNASSPPVATDDVEQLRRENAKLKMEIEILKNRPRVLPRPYA